VWVAEAKKRKERMAGVRMPAEIGTLAQIKKF